MDSPTLSSFDFKQFWLEQANNYNFLFEESSPVTSVGASETRHHSENTSTFKSEVSHHKPSNNQLPSLQFVKKIIEAKEVKSSEADETKIEATSDGLLTPNSTKPLEKYYKRDDTTEEAVTKRHERKENYKATKNLTKNYGTAIIGFARSDLAKPYLEVILPREKLNVKVFHRYLSKAKNKTRTIEAFRKLILVEDKDSQDMRASKRAFQAIGIIFIKYFSVNWIMHGRLTNKLTYLKWRFRILRRIEDPEAFTYLKFHAKKFKPKNNKDISDEESDISDS